MMEEYACSYPTKEGLDARVWSPAATSRARRSVIREETTPRFSIEEFGDRSMALEEGKRRAGSH